MKRSLVCQAGFYLLSLLGGGMSGGWAADVVNFETSSDYVTATNGQKMNGYTSAVTGVTYSESTSRYPSSGYNSARPSAKFYGGAVSSATNGLTTYRVNQVTGGDILQVSSTTANSTLTALFTWKQADFLALASGIVYLDATSSVQISNLKAGGSNRSVQVRLVLKQGGSYYISEVVGSASGTATANPSVTNPTTLNWHSYDPDYLTTIGAAADMSNFSFDWIGIHCVGTSSSGAAPNIQLTGIRLSGVAPSQSWTGTTYNGLISKTVNVYNSSLSGNQSRNALIKLPDDFYYSNPPDRKYPVIFFGGGTGEAAQYGGVDLLLKWGPLRFAHNGADGGSFPNPLSPPHKMEFRNPRDNKFYKFIVVAIQTGSGGAASSHRPLDYQRVYKEDPLIKDRIDPKGIFITGLSQNGRAAMLFLSDYYENTCLPEVAAIAPMAPYVNDNNSVTADAYHFAKARELQTPVWVFTGDQDQDKHKDPTKLLDYALNSVNPGQTLVTWFSGNHSYDWNIQYNPEGTTNTKMVNGHEMNVYEWFLYNMKSQAEYDSPIESVRSYKTHNGTALWLSMYPGRSDIEPRLPGVSGDYKLRINFKEDVVSMSAKIGTVLQTSTYVGTRGLDVNLIGVAGTGARVTVTLQGTLAASGAYTGTVSFRPLAGDVDGDGVVESGTGTSTDQSKATLQAGKTASAAVDAVEYDGSATVFTKPTVIREDVNYSGTVTTGSGSGTDISAISARNGNTAGN